jgi:hypothetical protein
MAISHLSHGANIATLIGGIWVIKAIIFYLGLRWFRNWRAKRAETI